jgi:lysyl-tRNA synthetase class II
VISHVLEHLDVGDIVGVERRDDAHPQGRALGQGAPFRILTKTLRPLPEKWHGLTDVAVRYRQRYVDLIVNDDVRETFQARSRIVSTSAASSRIATTSRSRRRCCSRSTAARPRGPSSRTTTRST